MGTVGCGSKAAFQGSSSAMFADGVPLVATPEPTSGAPNKVPQYTENFGYHLEIAQGKSVIPNRPTKARVWITDSLTGEYLSDELSKQWTASIASTKIPEAKGPLGEREIDFTNASGYTQVNATYVRTQDLLTGFTSQTIFVDSQPPTASMIVRKNETGQYSAAINVIDNYEIDDTKTVIIACKPPIDSPYTGEQKDGNGSELSPQCVVILNGDDLKAKGQSFPLEPVEIEQETFDPVQLKFFISATDSVGNKSTKPAIEASTTLPLLELGLEKDLVKIIRSGSELKAQITLLSVGGGESTAVHKEQSLWGAYVLDLDCPQGMSTVPFNSSLPLDTSTEGVISCTLQARKPSQNIKSNKISLGFLSDKTPPLITGVRVKNPQGFLDADTKISIFLNSSDANGIASQKIEYRPKGSTEWIPLSEVPVGDTSIIVKWDNRPKDDFEIRVISTDRAGNVTTSEPVKWSRPFFNAAVLTSSVNCFFCHLKIDGDVGGINFPTTVHSDTGTNFAVTGKIYGTGTVPTKLSDHAAGKEENYRNQSLRIFPNTKDSAGVPIFPVLQESKIEGNANGLLVNGSSRLERVSRVYTGDLIVEGSETKPFEVNGEVFVKGNLYIKGVYKGRGTIYARNIMIVNDVVSYDCLKPETCPFPFTGSEQEKLAQAQKAISDGKAALYLGALNEILVGSRKHKLDNTSTLPDPVSAFHLSLGAPAFNLKFPNGTEFICCTTHISSPTTDPRVNMEVNRVDAYLYAHKLITWRSFANLVLNGGFMGYKANLVSSIPRSIYHRFYQDKRPLIEIKNLINPRNNHTPTQNEIRYDYRLRVGGPGFETLKEFFND